MKTVPEQEWATTATLKLRSVWDLKKCAAQSDIIKDVKTAQLVGGSSEYKVGREAN